jgi:hypothetical protein
MALTVDLVVVGDDARSIAAAVAAARRGERVLIVLEQRDRSWLNRFRRSIRLAAVDRQIAVMAGTELVCVDGVGGIEAVVVRRIDSGRLVGINARAVRHSTLAADRLV